MLLTLKKFPLSILITASVSSTVTVPYWISLDLSVDNCAVILVVWPNCERANNWESCTGKGDNRKIQLKPFQWDSESEWMAYE